MRVFGTGRVEQDLPFGFEVRIIDVNFHQEAVELGFRQGIGAFLLKRVLGCQHVERFGQVVACAGDGDMLFLHGLQQRRLGTRDWRG